MTAIQSQTTNLSCSSEDSSPCGICETTLNQEDACIKCDTCEKWVCLKCINDYREESCPKALYDKLETLTDGMDFMWDCHKCVNMSLPEQLLNMDITTKRKLLNLRVSHACFQKNAKVFISVASPAHVLQDQITKECTNNSPEISSVPIQSQGDASSQFNVPQGSNVNGMESLFKMFLEESRRRDERQDKLIQQLLSRYFRDSVSYCGTESNNRMAQQHFKTISKLPKLELPHFSGAILEWPNFWESFQINVHSQPCLQDKEKMDYLHRVLEGPAKDKIKGLGVFGANYEEAVRILHEEYGNKEKVKDAHIRSLLKLAPVKDELSSLAAFRDQVIALTTALKQMEVPELLLDGYVYILQEKLPNSMQKRFCEWRAATDACDSAIKFKEFLALLRRQLKSWEPIQLPEPVMLETKNEKEQTEKVSLLVKTYAIPIDNGVKGYPEVTCGPHSIIVDVQTERPFNGRVFVKGEAHRKDCVRPFSYKAPVSYGAAPSNEYPPGPPPAHPPEQSGYGGRPRVGIELKFGECNMRRQRTVRCFYMESDKTVNAAIDVSMLTTHQLNQQYPMPQCNYHLKRGGYDGPYVRYAKVGDKVVHVWQCDKVAGYLYGILVKNCYVDDGQGNKVALINEEGCAIDQHLVPNLTYDEHQISAHVQSHVFKYADKSHLFFSCTIQLCFKNDGGCHGITPPKCGYGSPPSAAPHPNTYEIPKPSPVVFEPPQKPYLPVQGLAPSRPIAPPPPPRPYVDDNYGRFPPPELAIPHQGPFGAPTPYKDDPVNKEDSRKKRDLKQELKQQELTKKKLEAFEADISAPGIIVLPFDEDEPSEEHEKQLEQLTSLSAPKVDRKYHLLRNAHGLMSGVCMSTSGFGILLAVFVALFLLACSLTILLARKHCRADFLRADKMFCT